MDSLPDNPMKKVKVKKDRYFIGRRVWFSDGAGYQWGEILELLYNRKYVSIKPQSGPSGAYSKKDISLTPEGCLKKNIARLKSRRNALESEINYHHRMLTVSSSELDKCKGRLINFEDELSRLNKDKSKSKSGIDK